MGNPRFNFVGMDVADLAAIAGETITATRRWLSQNGYNGDDRTVRRIALPQEIQAEIAARLTGKREVPCWRCGARECGHQ